MNTSFWAVVRAILQKEAQAEFRTRELFSVMLVFALLSVLVFSFALELDRVLRREAVAGVLWVTVVFASVLGLNRSMAQERENGGMDALLLAPIPRMAIFFGKWLANYAITLVIGLSLLPLMTVLYNVTIITPHSLAILLLGVGGICAVGTLLSAMTVQARGGESLLPIVLLPVALPLLMACVRATTGILTGAPQADWEGWLPILMGIVLFYLAVCAATFGTVLEE
jgi:heme exporter protein B